MGLGRCGSRTSSVSTRCHPQHCLDCASDGSAHLGLLLRLVLSHLPSSSLSSSHSDRMTVLLHVVCLLAGCHCHHGHPHCLCPTLHCLSLSRYLRKAVSCASVFPTWGSCPVGGFLFPLHTVCAIATPCGPSGRALRSELTHLQGMVSCLGREKHVSSPTLQPPSQ